MHRSTCETPFLAQCLGQSEDEIEDWELWADPREVERRKAERARARIPPEERRKQVSVCRPSWHAGRRLCSAPVVLCTQAPQHAAILGREVREWTQGAGASLAVQGVSSVLPKVAAYSNATSCKGPCCTHRRGSTCSGGSGVGHRPCRGPAGQGGRRQAAPEGRWAAHRGAQARDCGAWCALTC